MCVTSRASTECMVELFMGVHPPAS